MLAGPGLQRFTLCAALLLFSQSGSSCHTDVATGVDPAALSALSRAGTAADDVHGSDVAPEQGQVALWSATEISYKATTSNHSGSLASPHWPHMRVGATDYWIHYQGARAPALWDWAAAHVDHVVGGSVEEYKKRNPTIRSMVYNLVWAPRQSDVQAMEDWLRTNGYDPESAYLHTAGSVRSTATRLAARIWDSDRYLTHPGDPGFRAWKQAQASQLTAVRTTGQRFDGLFIDELGTGVIEGRVPAATLEFASRDGYYGAFRELLALMREATPAKLIEVNIAQYSRPEDLAQANVAGMAMTEIANTPYAEMEAVWSYVERLVADGTVVHLSTGVTAATKNQPRRDMNPGNSASVAERVLLFEYASYLMVIDPQRPDGLYFNIYGTGTVPMESVWLRAFESDIGRANEPRRILQSGTDPNGRDYRIWGREFDHALVLARPKGKYDYEQYGNQTAVQVQLPPGPWRLLMGSGAVMGPLTAVDLRNGEAAILLR
ncbi:MAG: hypothetical protein L0271_04990 [Gemmatimonadetes bacterium]|nr:hypothetical protein [Gemmatimonadota bacterium]